VRIALDVNRYVDFMKGVPEAVRVLASAAAILMPFVVLAELRAGFRCGSQARRNERELGHFLLSDRVSVLWPDEATTHTYADLLAELRSAGTPIPTNDLWIAALTVQHGLVLFSRDRHFELIPRVVRV
jgi:tRNA(fMet)-specific endonuclease VapC